MRWLLRFAVGLLALAAVGAGVLLALGGWSGSGRNAAAIEVAAPASAVFPVLAQPEQWARWMGDLQSAEPMPGGLKPGAKTHYAVGNHDAAQPLEIEAEVVRVDPGRTLA